MNVAYTRLFLHIDHTVTHGTSINVHSMLHKGTNRQAPLGRPTAYLTACVEIHAMLTVVYGNSVVDDKGSYY